MTFIIPKKQPALRSHKKKNLYRLLVARSDIGAATAASKLFINTVSDLSDKLYYPLFTSIVICYARPFTNNEPYGALPEKWSKFENQLWQRRHDSILKARHELVAHSDMSVRKAKIVPQNVVIGNNNVKELKSARIGIETSYYLFTIPMIKETLDVAINLGRRMNDEIEVVLDDLYGGMELPNAKFSLRIDEGL